MATEIVNILESNTAAAVPRESLIQTPTCPGKVLYGESFDLLGPSQVRFLSKHKLLSSSMHLSRLNHYSLHLQRRREILSVREGEALQLGAGRGMHANILF